MQAKLYPLAQSTISQIWACAIPAGAIPKPRCCSAQPIRSRHAKIRHVNVSRHIFGVEASVTGVYTVKRTDKLNMIVARTIAQKREVEK